ncbi:hypothetical protein OIU85_006682 [Salix viminalis]|uniref:Uncharacterized protein n=1 Tax=Salix viminalis TaxID=40686 RepID=A0A9Q0PLX0_SALVM|nr:hypothetical protein OIU85_006682 [Salix viminalis]
MQWIPLRKLARPVTAHVQLWLEKLGAKEPFSGNVAICRTIAREEEALGRYKLTAGNIVLFHKFKVHGKSSLEDDWLACSFTRWAS